MHISILLSTLIMLSNLNQREADAQNNSACTHTVYCSGPLPVALQSNNLCPIEKWCIDAVLKTDEDEISKSFFTLLKSIKGSITRTELLRFFYTYFSIEPELDPWTPKDFNGPPAEFDRIESRDMRSFAKTLANLLPGLGRQVNEHVKQYPQRHSLENLEHGFFINGGDRFMEMSYSESYYIIRGLLICNMKESVKQILNNFCYLISKYKHIPKGSRLYYVGRTNPPLFAAMVEAYIKYTNDIDWLKDHIMYIEEELTWWTEKKFKDTHSYGKVPVYQSDSSLPRAEAYYEDVYRCTEYYGHDPHIDTCYNSLNAASSSGWEFSSRWMESSANDTEEEEGNKTTHLARTRPDRLIPVDLTAFLCQAFKFLAKFYNIIGNTNKEKQWTEKADDMYVILEKLLYSKEDGIWYDYDMQKSEPRKTFYASNFVPLYTQCYDLNKKEEYGANAARYFNTLGIMDYHGVPASLIYSKQQWDFPNAFAPSQYLVVFGLQKTGNKEAGLIADRIVKRWLESNLIGYDTSGTVFDRYDVMEAGKRGSEGEYPAQEGHGWTIGVDLTFFHFFFCPTPSKSTRAIMLNSVSCAVCFTLLMMVGQMLGIMS